MEARRVYMDKHWKKVIGFLCFGMMSTMPFTAFGDMHDGNGAAVAAEADADHDSGRGSYRGFGGGG